MKKTLKKAIALLTAGVLLSASAAVYAAQVPPVTAPADAAALTSSQEKLSLTFQVNGYTLTETAFDATFRMVPSQGQIRLGDSKISVMAQTPDGGWEQVYFGGSTNGGDPNSIHVRAQVNMKKGQKVQVFIEGMGEVFNGYTYVGSAYGSSNFEFTL